MPASEAPFMLAHPTGRAPPNADPCRLASGVNAPEGLGRGPRSTSHTYFHFALGAASHAPILMILQMDGRFAIARFRMFPR